MKPPEYTLETYEHGWLLCPAKGQTGVPLDALAKVAKQMPKGAVIDSGIAGHYRRSGHAAVVALYLPGRGKLWRAELEQSIAALPPQERWWRSTDVGMSSATIYAALTDCQYRAEAMHMVQAGSTPYDADDMGRCVRLLNLLPEWRPRLTEVATAFPLGRWGVIAPEWARLESMTDQQQTEELRKLNTLTVKPMEL